LMPAAADIGWMLDARDHASLLRGRRGSDL
jgi:hypothetical protein